MADENINKGTDKIEETEPEGPYAYGWGPNDTNIEISRVPDSKVITVNIRRGRQPTQAITAIPPDRRKHNLYPDANEDVTE